MSKYTRVLIVLLLAVFLTILKIDATRAGNIFQAEQPSLQMVASDTQPPLAKKIAYAPLACSPLGGYAHSLEQPNYCVYYNTPPTSATDAALVEGYVDDYWDRYSVDFGFDAPHFTAPKLEVRIEDFSNCNGSAWQNYIKVYDGCFDPALPEFMQYVTGHEIFHRVQFAHDPDWASTWTNSSWIYEGTARNMEDTSYTNVDTWANCLSVPFSYCDEVNDYLASTHADITSHGMRYEANLFWTFFREQYGTTATEPQRGVDAIVELWDQMCCAESVAAVNNTLAVISPGTTFNDAFRQFTVANWTKDLTGLPDDSYNYADEDQTGNPAPYGPLTPSNGGTIDSGTSATWGSQSINKYSARYYAATPDASDCQIVTASFARTGGSAEFYHIITQYGTAFGMHVEGSGASWSQSFLNDGITKIVAIAGGQGSSSTVGVSLSCSTPTLEIELPAQLAPAYVGPYNSPDNTILQVAVTDGSPTGPVVGGLTNADFSVEVGGMPALVLGGGFIQEEYFILIDTPTQGANGPYDLEVFLEKPGTSIVIASDTETDAIVYDATDTDHVIITDVSGSMGWDNKLQAAQDAANLFVDAMNSSEGLGLSSYNHDVGATLGIQFATLPHRTSAETQINAYTAGGATSIGDGLNEAVTLLGASPTGNARCQFTLLSDGMENSSLYWTDVQAAVVATGCPVNTIAFGAASNELLMQDIATATGGAAYYNDVFVSSRAAPGSSPDDTELELGDTYLYTLCEAQDCERLYTEQGVADDYYQVISHTMSIDASVTEMVVVLDWRPTYQGDTGSDFAMILYSPSGVGYNVYAFENPGAGHLGYRVDNPEAGEWMLAIVYINEISNRKYQVLAYGQTETTVNLLMPGALGGSTGDQIPLHAIWMPGGVISATVTAPDGTESVVPLHDDGEHGDGAPGDGFFGAWYTLVNQAVEVWPEQEEGVPNPPTPFDEGAYRVHLLALFGDMRRESRGSFAVPEGADEDPADGVPDNFIDTHCPGAPNSDADLDQLDCSDEYFTGTDPNNSDTDGGGESDESEAIRHGTDPFDPSDDEIEALDFVQTTPQNGSVRLTYDVKAEYFSMWAYQATSPDGPWILLTNSLPLTGVYSDTSVTNDTDYYYCLQAIDGSDHWSAVVCSVGVTPREDPIPPEATVLINDGAAETTSPNVTLSFAANEEGPSAGLFSTQDSFSDISEVMISNDPAMTGATWQTFSQGMTWQLTSGNGLRTIFVRFRDTSGNESLGIETATIFLDSAVIYLPAIMR